MEHTCHTEISISVRSFQSKQNRCNLSTLVSVDQIRYYPLRLHHGSLPPRILPLFTRIHTTIPRHSITSLTPNHPLWPHLRRRTRMHSRPNDPSDERHRRHAHPLQQRHRRPAGPLQQPLLLLLPIRLLFHRERRLQRRPHRVATPGRPTHRRLTRQHTDPTLLRQ